MKVILLKDVGGVGKQGEVTDVPKGHALNFLVPQKMAEPATPEKIAAAARMQEKKERETDRLDEAFLETLKKLEGGKLEMAVAANEKGSLFEGIKAADVAAFLSEKGFEILPSYIALASPIKELGEHEITLKKGDSAGTFSLVVTAK